MLGFVIPLEGEGVRVAIDGVGYGDHLMEIRWNACELGQVLLGHGAGGLAVVKTGPIGIVVQGFDAATSSDIVCRAASFPGVFGCVALQGRTIGIVGGSVSGLGCGCSVGGCGVAAGRR
jgi:hypothetical protein